MQIQVGEVEIAKSTFRTLVSEIKITSQQYQLIATHLASQKEYQEAVGYLRLGIQEDPQSSLPLLMDLVQYEQKMGDLSSALNTLETAIGLDPQNRLLQVVKADMQAFGGDTNEAILTLEQVNTKTEPETDDPASWHDQRLNLLLRLIYLYRKSGAIEKAIQTAEQCLLDYPGEGEATYLLADMAYHQLNLSKAHELVEELQILGAPQSQISDLAVILKSKIDLEARENRGSRHYIPISKSKFALVYMEIRAGYPHLASGSAGSKNNRICPK